MAGEAEIVKLSLSFSAPGNDMVHDHWIPRIRLSRLTIRATVIVRLKQLLTEFRCEIGAHIALQLVGGRDGMTSPAQQGRGMGFSQHQLICFSVPLRQLSMFGFRYLVVGIFLQ